MINFQISSSQNRVYLSGNSLMLNIQDPTFDDLSEKLKSKK
jgi:prohibitin 2